MVHSNMITEAGIRIVIFTILKQSVTIATMEPPAAAPKRIVIVEDDMSLAEIYKTRLEAIGYNCIIAYNGITALYFIQKEVPDLVLLDIMIPDISGDQVLATMRRSTWGKTIPVYIISNLNESEAPVNLRELGIAGYSVKANLSNDQIDGIVNSLLEPWPICAAQDTPRRLYNWCTNFDQLSCRSANNGHMQICSVECPAANTRIG